MEVTPQPPRSLVVNFNSPELTYLALTLTRNGALTRYVRPYVNKERWWERALASTPKLGALYADTFGRRHLGDRRLAELTVEAGSLADIGATAIGRLRSLPSSLRARTSYQLHERVRHAVSRTAARLADNSECVIAYTGFGLPAFEVAKARAGKAVVNYPIAHHRYHREVQREEHEREPEFRSTWPTLSDWPAAYEERVDREIEVADRILVGSSYARESFVRQGIAPAKLAVASYGVDLATFNARPGAREIGSATFNVIFAGQLSQRKGISYLLRAYKRFRKPDTRLTLVGGVPESNEPFRPYTDLFRHVPHQTRPALAQMYRASDVFVFPTLLEGMGLVVLEAMACGLPVIATANGPGDVVRDGVDGFIVPARDEEAIRDRLELLYRDREMRVEMGRNARARAQEFDWSAYGNRVLAVLTELARACPAEPGAGL